MVLASLQHGGEEQLAQRHGLQAYAENGSTMGVPLLHPWANRLEEPHYQAAGVKVRLDRDSSLIQLDEHDLPIHGGAAQAVGLGAARDGR
jgi:aldose 1-epimerase